MLINAPNHTLAARPFLPAQSVEQTSGAFERMLKRIHGLVCGMHGHDSVLQYERNRMFLRCTSCGHETPGWEVTPAAFQMRRAEPRPARAAAPDLEMFRRIA
jgi:hypothetical protein